MITSHNNMQGGNGRAMVERFFMVKYFLKQWEEECDAREEMADEDVKETLHQLAQDRFEQLNPPPPSDWFYFGNDPPSFWQF